MHAYSHRPELTSPFEMQRRVTGGFFKKFETGISQFLNVAGKRLVALPESWRGKMCQICLHRPLL
jgi:hypothetical protein